MDPLHLCIALCPLSAYVLLLGLINLSSRPLVTSGARDLAALAMGISGLVCVGPVELFFPESAVAWLGAYVWLLLAGLYALLAWFLMLILRPRVVLYNVTPEQLRPALADVVVELDADARWAGECLVLPRLGIQLHLETFPAMRNIQLASSGPHQSYAGWRRLERALAKALKSASSTPNPYGFSLVFFGLLMVALVTFSVVNDADAVARGVAEMLRR